MAFDYNALTQANTLFQNLTSPQRHEILTVNSLQQVKDFVMNKGDSYLLLDPNSDILYIREMDTIGKSTIRAFRLTEITEEIITNTTPVTINKSEYEKLLKRLAKLEEGVKNDTKKSEQSEQPELNFQC